MSKIQMFQVLPTIPAPIAFLEVLARNLWWSWMKDAKELFRRVDPRTWDAAGRNPVLFLSEISQRRLEELAVDDSFLAHMHHVRSDFERQLAPIAVPDEYRFDENDVIAYLSMEFGIHESIPLFAGGLGVLAGDHLKAASNIGIPLVGVGLLYRQGYFRQLLDPEGWQQESYPETDFFHLPIERVKDVNGSECRISVAGPDGDIQADVWVLRIGRVSLYLLDTNIHENRAAVRDITARLYAGDQKLRLAQEVLLGIGGIRALSAVGYFPKLCHMNEGHSAFSSIERLALFMQRYNVDLKTAMEIVPRSTVFTTHTPVAAGHDEFPADMVRPYLEPFEEKLGVEVDEILSWGQIEGKDPHRPISMFVLGLHMAQHLNGVSKLHGSVARRMWAYVWPGRTEDEVPISHVTNGVHVCSYISDEFARLFERYLGPDWHLATGRKDVISRIDEIYDEELWRAHEMNRSRLVRNCRQSIRRQYEQRNAPRSIIEEVETVLEPDVLTIGFARRFATYKRANLLLQDPARLEAILLNKKHPVQIIFAGKAHPKDNEGKVLIQRLVRFARKQELRRRFIFVEDYDMHLARHLVQGCDVWLNTPRRPYEACGTSGMKAAANGVLNASILDGWWCEGYTEDRGWAIGHGEEYQDDAYQDMVESQALYNVLESDLIPCFYERRNGEAPHCWIKKMKASIKMALQDFCSLRMVMEYEKRFYIPAAVRTMGMTEGGAAEARRLSAQVGRLRSLWAHVHIGDPAKDKTGPFRMGDRFRVAVTVSLGELRPEEVDVELYYGPIQSVDALRSSRIVLMEVAETIGEGQYRYVCHLNCERTGRQGFTARVTPRGDERIKFTPKLITWS